MKNSDRSKNLKAQETPGKLSKFGFQRCPQVGAVVGKWQRGATFQLASMGSSDRHNNLAGGGHCYYNNNYHPA